MKFIRYPSGDYFGQDYPNRKKIECDTYQSIDKRVYDEKSISGFGDKLFNLEYTELSELSEFFNENYPEIFYSKGNKKWLKYLKGKVECSISGFLNEDNFFIFNFIKTNPSIKQSDYGKLIELKNLTTSLVIITKIKDEYYLVHDISRGASLFPSAFGCWPKATFMCDNIDGLVSFLSDGLDHLKNYEYDGWTWNPKNNI